MRCKRLRPDGRNLFRNDYDWDPNKFNNSKSLEQAISFYLAFVGTDIYTRKRPNKFANENINSLPTCTSNKSSKQLESRQVSLIYRFRPAITRTFIWANAYLLAKCIFFVLFGLQLQQLTIGQRPIDDLWNSVGGISSLESLIWALQPRIFTQCTSPSNKMFICVLFVAMLTINCLMYRLRNEDGQHLNCIKFVLDPESELKRVDTNIQRLLHQTESSMTTFSAEMLNISRSRVKLVCVSDQLKFDSASLGFLMRLLGDDWRLVTRLQNSEQSALRLSCHHEHSYCIMRRLVSNCIVGFTCAYLFLIAIVDTAFFIQSSNKCKDLGLDYTLKLSDYRFLVEFSLVQLGSELAAVGLVLILASLIFMQLSLIKASKRELHECLHEMDQIEAANEKRKHCKQAGENYLLSYRDILRRTNRLMFSSMVKLKVNGRELSQNSFGLKVMMEIFLLIMIILISIGISLEFFEQSDRIFRLLIVLPCWLLANLAAAACAFCQARALELQRFQWCFIARAIAIFEPLDQDHVWRPTGGMGFAAVMWRRYIQSVDFWQTTVVPNPAGLVISYHTILEFNFFIISILTLLLSRSK